MNSSHPKRDTEEIQSTAAYSRIGKLLVRFYVPMLFFAVLCGVITGVLIQVMDPDSADWVAIVSMFILLPMYATMDAVFNRDLIWCPLRASGLMLGEGLTIWMAGGFQARPIILVAVSTTLAWILSGIICLVSRVLIEN